ncbi:hypothetical protein C8A03DRAFT_30963 [Achaetomium macrosporum]|uniref:Galactose oxidase n=1 Tax=Achaetomium macrosporum TaxID=79813 RepID=A0AAN7H963_9PEZI|nr:hypothetical protein C8A03DRAFT_30963 [Achaetomium macrosporum]
MPAPAWGTAPAEPGPWLSPMEGSSAATRPRPRSRPTHRRAASVWTTFAFAVLGRVVLASAEPALPYIPTTILLPSNADGNSSPVAYIFAPSADSPGAVDFLSLDVSSTLRSSSLQPTKLTSALPFLAPDTGNCTTFAASLLPNGTIALVVGNCSPGSASSLWTSTPDPATKNPPQWSRHAITPSSGWDNAQSGPYHLGGILSFSAQLSPVLSPPILYLYGGMCPFPNSSSSSSSSSASGETTWQQPGAIYSNRMLRLTPPSSSSPSPSPSPSSKDLEDYALSYCPGPQPVAEAGFTLTALPPSLSNLTTSDGRMVTQQTSHVMLGGHTRNAFVNMSTAAVWSLPEESWSFVGIAPPSPSSGTTKTDLARQAQVATVDSRSGHTAVLSADGTRLVVYGGWVGDMRTAAVPQLVVVRVGVGLSDWAWEIPDGQEEEDGIGGLYGHGAALLPGNVMMVYGGYEIAPEGGGGGRGVGRKRQMGKGGRMFYNITSGRWSDEYVSPLAGSANGGGNDAGDGSSPGPSDSNGSSNGSSDGSSADDSSRKRQIGLGVGLGVGGLILLVLAALGVRWFRRRQKRRAAREETLRSLAQGVGVNGSLPRGLGEDDEMLEREYGMGLFPWTAAAAREWYTGGGGPYTQGRRSLGYETLRGGSRPGPSLYIPPPPSPSSASGRLKGARGLYQPTSSSSSYDFTPLGRARNGIEPIYEADEDEDGDLGKGYLLSPDKEERDDDDDPFVTPTLSSPRHSNSPTPPPPQQPQGQGGGGQQQDPDVQGWVSDVDAASSNARLTSTRNTSSKRTNPGSPPRHQTNAASSSRQQPTTTGRMSPLRRALSTKSAKSAKSSCAAHRLSPTTDSSFHSVSVSVSDDGGSHRTGSNLSERSTFSFVPGTGNHTAGAEDRVLLSRLHTTLASTTTTATAVTAAVVAGDGTSSTSRAGRTRSDSVGSTSASASGKSYSTAKSHLSPNFAVLREEGPGLLMGTASAKEGGGDGVEDEQGDGEAEEEDYYYLHAHHDDEPGSPSKSKQPKLLRRSWLGSLKRVFGGSGATPESGSSSDASGSPTREALLGSSSDSYYYDGRLSGTGLQRRRQQQGGREAWGVVVHQDNEEELEDWDRDIERAAAQRTVQIMFTVPKEPLRVVNAEIEREESVLIVDPADDDEAGYSGSGGSSHHGNDNGGGASPAVGEEVPAERQANHHHQLLEPPVAEEEGRGRDRLSSATLEPPVVGVSPSPSLRAPSITTATLHTAEAVRLERPKTRVLEMVESIESRSSREGSPSGSPVRD